MQGLAEHQMAYEHCEELLGEVERGRLARELRVVCREERLRLRDHVQAALQALRRKPSSLFAGQAR